LTLRQRSVPVLNHPVDTLKKLNCRPEHRDLLPPLRKLFKGTRERLPGEAAWCGKVKTRTDGRSADRNFLSDSDFLVQTQ
jgi:hypothetical protein